MTEIRSRDLRRLRKIAPGRAIHEGAHGFMLRKAESRITAEIGAVRRSLDSVEGLESRWIQPTDWLAQ